ncbi:class I SAM-dependent methyltransferase [Photobacterium japonica]|uniref:class I SAM-dependent methyltransferase n=1 Tax=Photobacterium japonica TaxID=2910235 RepID=UPI003D126156
MDKNAENWRQFYNKALRRPHTPRTERAITLNQSGSRIAVDCGCGTGSDIQFLASQDYTVHAFDINSDAITICRERFEAHAPIFLTQASFETFTYPQCGVLIANSSLFFADPDTFTSTWQRLVASLASGGVFAGDFMGVKDSWAENYRSPTAPVTRTQLASLLADFDIIEWNERDAQGTTMLGFEKHWHTYSVLAIKR